MAEFGHPAREHRRDLTCLTVLRGRVRSWEARPTSGDRVRIARRRAEEERGDTFSSPSDEEVGGSQARSAASDVAPPICRRSRRNELRPELIRRYDRFVGFDEDGGSTANIAASGASHLTERALASGAIKLGNQYRCARPTPHRTDKVRNGCLVSGERDSWIRTSCRLI